MRTYGWVRWCLHGGHAWIADGDTLGGIWLKCTTCDATEEFLPGLHEPKGGQEAWDALLKRTEELRGDRTQS